MSDAADILQVSPRVSWRHGALPEHVLQFYDAYLARDEARLAAVLHDDVKCQITGPSDQFDFYGPRSGKQEVLELIVRILPCYFLLTSFDFEHVLVQGDKVATYGQVSARQRETGRSIRYRTGGFLRFRDGKVIDYRVIADTFDTAQQLVGHAIDVRLAMQEAPLVPGDDIPEL